MSTTAKQEEKAYRLLEYPEEYPGLLERREFDRKLLLFRYPSFGINTSWSLFNTNKEFWIRRIEWDRSRWFPSEDAEPFTFGCEIPCSSEFAEKILSSLSLIEFCPLKQPELIGLDGTIHGIKTGNYWLSCSLRWWYLPTDDWKPLAQWFEKSANMFEKILPQSTCRSM
jgi:hypothetical protein